MRPPSLHALLLGIVLFSGCATARHGDSGVKLVDRDGAATCKELGKVKASAAAGIPTYYDEALAQAKRQVATLGGNALLIESSENDQLFTGQTVAGRAFRCGG
ncbi:MAG: hypothetical protein HY904_13770 [Deltaproteobacteria bacterium]|nr:hypothetical protein [Deltaproteobacteria bacterium]